MSDRQNKRIKLVLEWDRPAKNELTPLAHKAILQRFEDELKTLKQGYVAGDVKVDRPHRPPYTRYRVEVRIFPNSHVFSGRHTSWSHVMRFVAVLKQYMEVLPKELNADAELDWPKNVMPYVITDGQWETERPRIWLRDIGATDAAFVTTPKKIDMVDQASMFSNMFRRSSGTTSEVHLKFETISAQEFFIVGSERAVRKVRHKIELLGQKTVSRPTDKGELVSFISHGAVCNEETVLVLYKDAGIWRPIPGTGYVINNHGFSPDIMNGEHEQFSLPNLNFKRVAI